MAYGQTDHIQSKSWRNILSKMLTIMHLIKWDDEFDAIILTTLDVNVHAS